MCVCICVYVCKWNLPHHQLQWARHTCTFSLPCYMRNRPYYSRITQEQRSSLRCSCHSWTHYLDHGISLYGILLLLIRLTVIFLWLFMVLRIQCRACAESRCLYCLKRVRGQVDLLIISSCEGCFHLKNRGKRLPWVLDNALTSVKLKLWEAQEIPLNYLQNSYMHNRTGSAFILL